MCHRNSERDKTLIKVIVCGHGSLYQYNNEKGGDGGNKQFFT
jgi:hypothetical protein